MSPPTYADFVAQYPEFIPVPTPSVQRQLAFSTKLLDEGAWGDFYAEAIGLDVAHNLALARMTTEAGAQGAFQGAVGPVSSVSAAGISTSFAVLSPDGKSASRDWYNKTGYGQRFLRLRQVVIPLGEMAS